MCKLIARLDSRRAIVGESESSEGRIFNLECKLRPTDRPQSLPQKRLAGEAIKLQFHGLTPRKTTRGTTFGDVVLSLFCARSASDRTSLVADCIITRCP